MAQYATLKAAIDAVIKANGQREITGTVLNQTLNAMVNSLGANYQFAGVATPSTNPGTPDQNVCYLAGQGGTYTNFNNIAIPNGISFLLWNGSWSSQTVLSGDGGVFDISAYKATGGTLATFADLSAALGENGANVPIKFGGMQVRFVSSSDNKYEQYRLMSNTFNTTVANWQGVDDKLTAGSKNLVDGKGVYDAIKLPINTQKIISSSYLAKTSDVEGKVKIMHSGSSSNCCAFYKLQKNKKYTIIIPTASAAGRDYATTIAFSNEISFASASSNILLDGSYIETAPPASGTGITTSVVNTNYKYLIVCYSGDLPEVSFIQIEDFEDYVKYDNDEGIVHSTLSECYIRIPSEITDLVYLKHSSDTSNKIAIYDVEDAIKIGVVIPVSNAVADTPTVVFTNDEIESGVISQDTGLADGTYISNTPLSNGTDIKFEVENSEQYKYLMVSYSGNNAPEVTKISPQGFRILLNDIKYVDTNLEEKKADKTQLDNYNDLKQVPNTEVSVATSCYLNKVSGENTITISKSGATDNSCFFYKIHKGFKYSVLIPKPSTTGSSNSTTVAYANSALSGAVSSAQVLDGAYINGVPASSGTNISYLLRDAEDYNYIVVCCNTSGGNPVVKEFVTDEYIYLNAAKVNTEEMLLYANSKSELQTLEDYSTITRCYLNKTPDSEGTIKFNAASNEYACCKFYRIVKGVKYDITVPKSGNPGSSYAALAAYANDALVRINSELRRSLSIDGAYISGIPNASNVSRHFVIESAEDYPYLVVHYNSDGGEPVVKQYVSKEYIREINELYRIDNYAKNNYNNIKNTSTVKINCGFKLFDTPFTHAWCCHIDGEYSYLGYGGGFTKVHRSKNGEINIVDTYTIGEGTAYDHIVTGIKTDDTYLYLSTRDGSIGGAAPISGVAGYLMIYDKATMTKVSETVLYWKGTQCYLYENNYVIVPLQLYGWSIYDVTDKANPVLVKFFESDHVIEYQHCATWEDNSVKYAAFSCFASGVRIFNITDKANPVFVANYTFPLVDNAQIHECFDVCVKYPYLYATKAPMSEYQRTQGSEKALMCFNISDPSNFAATMKKALIPIEERGSQQDGDGQPNYMVVHNNVAVVNLDNVGLAVFRANGDDISFSTTYNLYFTLIRPIDVSDDGLVLAFSNEVIWYNRFFDIESIESMQKDINELKTIVANLT